MEHQQFKEWLERSLHDELDAQEQQTLGDHLATCAECRGELESLKKLQAHLQRFPRLEVTDALLMEARQELRAALRIERSRVSLWKNAVDKVDELFAPWVKVTAGAVAMLAVGFVAGSLFSGGSPVQEGMLRTVSDNTEVLRGQPRITNVHFDDADASDGEVSFSFDAVTSVQVKGSPNDPGVQSVLTKALVSEENPGVRLRTVSAITSQIQIGTSSPNKADNEVKLALIDAMKFDQNPGVRREAMNALKKFPMDTDVKQGLLYVLSKDKNEALRVEAITSLALAKDETYASDQHLLDILKKKVESDNNRYVRQRARAVLEEVK